MTYGGETTKKMHECSDGVMKPLMKRTDTAYHEYFCQYCRQYTRFMVATESPLRVH